MSLFEKFTSAFISPSIRFDEEGKKLIYSYLNVILIVSICILPPYIVLKIFQAHGIAPSDFIKIGLELVFAAIFYILKKDMILISGLLFLIVSWSAMTGMAWYDSGIQDVAIVGYIIIIFLATLVTGIRVAFGFTALSIISVWILGIFQMKNRLIPIDHSALDYSRDYTLIFILVLTAIILFAKSYRNSYDRINKELIEKAKAEEELSKNEVRLREKNEELMVSRDKAEESDRLKTAFIRNISHEIRTPMNGIVGFVNLLQEPGTRFEKLPEYVGIINSCTQQLATLVNDLIDISKIETGTIELNISEYPADKLLNDLENTFSKTAREKGLIMTIVNNVGNTTVRSDHSKIKQVLYNLVSNSIKFTPAGSITVKVSRTENDIIFSVADTGIGIRESDKSVIFDRFRQAEAGLTRSYGGSGLGLAISKGNIEFLKGKLWFDSQPEKGSVFSFSVPVEFLSGMEMKITQALPVTITKKIKILAAEDNEINFLYIKELLSAPNFELVWARDGLEAVELFRKRPDFDVVLMDLKMPVMNGYDATVMIKNINSGIPVIAVTAYNRQEDISRANGVNFDGYIVKPIEKIDLMKKIKNVLIPE